MEYINTTDTAGSWMIIIAVLLVVAIIYKAIISYIMPLFKSRSRQEPENDESEKGSYSHGEIRGIIDGYRLHINKFNTLIKYYPEAEEGLRNKAIEFQDKKALSFAARQAMKFTEAMEEAGKMFNIAEDAAKNRETGKMADAVADFSSSVDMMQIIYDGISGYKVVDTRPDTGQSYKKLEQEKTEKNIETEVTSGTGSIFFEGCRNIRDVEKRYRALCKAYHPDQGYGEAKIFRQLNEEYVEAKQKHRESSK